MNNFLSKKQLLIFSTFFAFITVLTGIWFKVPTYAFGVCGASDGGKACPGGTTLPPYTYSCYSPLYNGWDDDCTATVCTIGISNVPCSGGYSEGGYPQGGYQSSYEGGYPTPTPIPPKVTARVYVDTDDDGQGDVQYSGSDPARVNLSGKGGQNAPFTWTNLVMGQSYTLNLGLPTGYIKAGTESGTRSITIRNSLEVRTFSIRQDVWDVAARVYVDTDDDGVGDTPYSSGSNPAHINLSLHGGFLNSHIWQNVSPGSYALNLGLPAGYVFAGSEDGNRAVTIASGGGNKSYTFSIRRDVYKVAAILQVDLNGDGVADVNYIDSSNPGRVKLSGDAGFDNSHTWIGKDPGLYTVTTSLPAGYAYGCGDSGSRSFSIVSGPQDKTYSFHICITPNAATPTPTPFYSITGIAHVESDDNCTVNGADNRLDGVHVRIAGTKNGSCDTGTSGVGVCTSSPYQTGPYTVTVSESQLPAGYEFSGKGSTDCEDGTRAFTLSKDTTFNFFLRRIVATPTPIPGSTNLIARNLAETGTTEVNQPITIKGSIFNNSVTSSGKVSLARFCVFSGTFNSTDRQNCYDSGTGRLGSDISTNILAASAEQFITASTTWSTTTAGLYTSYICADSTKVIVESDDSSSNNCQSSTFTINPAPTPPPPGINLTAAINPVPIGTLTNQTLTFSGIVRNNGTSTTGKASSARFCVRAGTDTATKSQECLDSAIGRVGSDVAVNTLAAGATQAVTANATWATIAAGQYVVYLCSDSGKVIIESVETAADNCDSFQYIVNDPIVSTNSISGRVFIDTSGDHKYGSGDSVYSGSSLVIRYGPGITDVVSTNSANGTYTIPVLPAGTYSVQLTSIPAGYSQWPTTGFIQVQLGPCTPPVDQSTGGACDASGNAININFALSQSSPWIQAVGLDTRFDSSMTNVIPPGSSCTQFALLPSSGNTPGVWFNGGSAPNFGPSGAASDQSQGWNWRIGGAFQDMDRYPPGALKTSYNSLETTIKSSKTAIDDTFLSGKCPGGVCAIDSSFTGVLRSTDPIYITAPSKIINGQKVILLVQDDVHITGDVDVEQGGYLLIVSTGDIYFDNNVGNSPSCSVLPSPSTNAIEGIFVADKNIRVETVGSNCSSGPDKQLTVQGTLITNAARLGGSLINARSLCAGNVSFPTLRVTERPDFILSAPSYIQSKPIQWKEVAP